MIKKLTGRSDSERANAAMRAMKEAERKLWQSAAKLIERFLPVFGAKNPFKYLITLLSSNNRKQFFKKQVQLSTKYKESKSSHLLFTNFQNL